MDRLAMNAMLARQAGMTYGKWKAMQPIVPIEKPEIPEGWVKCEECGKAFPPRNKKRFCDGVCRRAAYEKNRYFKKQRMEYMQKYRARKAEENGEK